MVFKRESFPDTETTIHACAGAYVLGSPSAATAQALTYTYGAIQMPVHNEMCRLRRERQEV